MGVLVNESEALVSIEKDPFVPDIDTDIEGDAVLELVARSVAEGVAISD